MSNLMDALKVERPGDVQRLKEHIPILQRFSDFEVQGIYKAFSWSYSAGWLILTEEIIKEFEEWL